MMVSLLMSQKDTLLFMLVKTEVGTLFQSHSWLTLSSNPSLDKLKKNLALIMIWASLFLVKKLFSSLLHQWSDERRVKVCACAWRCMMTKMKQQLLLLFFLTSLFVTAILVLINVFYPFFFSLSLSFFFWVLFEQPVWICMSLCDSNFVTMSNFHGVKFV